MRDSYGRDSSCTQILIASLCSPMETNVFPSKLRLQGFLLSVLRGVRCCSLRAVPPAGSGRPLHVAKQSGLLWEHVVILWEHMGAFSQAALDAAFGPEPRSWWVDSRWLPPMHPQALPPPTAQAREVFLILDIPRSAWVVGCIFISGKAEDRAPMVRIRPTNPDPNGRVSTFTAFWLCLILSVLIRCRLA